METILFLFALALISIIGMSLSDARVELRTLKARLDRRDALEAKKPERSGLDAWAEAISVKELKSRISGKDKEIEALEHTITLKDETIKNLNGDIAKLKFEYACEVAGRNEGKTKYQRPIEWKAEKIEIDGVPHLKVMIRKPYQIEPSPVIIPIDSDLTMDKERLLALEIKPSRIRGEWVDEFTEIKREDFDKSKPRRKDNACECCAGSGENRAGEECATCNGTGQSKPIKHKSPDENTDGRA